MSAEEAGEAAADAAREAGGSQQTIAQAAANAAARVKIAQGAHPAEVAAAAIDAAKAAGGTNDDALAAARAAFNNAQYSEQSEGDEGEQQLGMNAEDWDNPREIQDGGVPHEDGMGARGQGEGQGQGQGQGQGDGDGDGDGQGSGGGSGGGGGGGQGGGGGLATFLADDEIQMENMDAEELAEHLLKKVEEDKEMADKLLKEAREVAQKAAGEQRRNEGLAEVDDALYERLYAIVSKQIGQLRVVLEVRLRWSAFLAVGMRSLSLFWWPQGLEAKEKERVWVRNQNAGELDDTKLVDGATGERNIFKKRGNNNPMFGNVQMHPKRAINLLLPDGHSSPGVLRCSGLRFLMDVSSSMSRFNGTDRRLDRMCASTVMIMEAFQGERTGCVCEVWASNLTRVCAGLEHKYHYEIIGHSGESHRITFVGPGSVTDAGSNDGMPRTRADRLAVVQEMYSRAFLTTYDCFAVGSRLIHLVLLHRRVLLHERRPHFGGVHCRRGRCDQRARSACPAAVYLALQG